MCSITTENIVDYKLAKIHSKVAFSTDKGYR